MGRMWRTLGRLSAAILSTTILVIGWPAVPAQAAGQVTNIANASITETNAAATLAFNITYTGGTAAETVNWATTSGTATAPADFTASSGTASLPAAGCQCATVNVPVVGDLLDENTEAFTITLSSPSVGTLGTATATGTITDNDPNPVVAIAGISQNEGNSGTTNQAFTITLTPASGRTASVSYLTQNGTAASGSDFTGTRGSVTFAPGETSKTIGIPVIGDMTVEANETFAVRLFGASNASYATSRTGTGTIVNDDSGPVLTAGNASRTEGNTGTAAEVFTVSLSQASAQTVTVKYATADGTATAGPDYTSTTGTLTFTAGQLSKTVSVLVKGDTLSEANETFSVTMNTPVNATIGAAGTGTIVDDDPLPTIAINDVTTAEGNTGTTTASFAVTLNTASGQTVAVDWTTAPGSASAGSDYAGSGGTVTFAPGQTSQTVTVPVFGDTIDEINETYTVGLATALNATIADNQGVGTITDDDAAPSIAIADASLLEGNTGTATATLAVALSTASGKSITVNWASADATATAGPDYTAGSGTLTFAPGETSKLVSLTVLGDVLNEGDETFNVNLSAAVNATIADNQGVGTITDDDPQPGLALSDVVATEGNTGTTNATFTISLDKPSGRTVTVDWTTTPGSASAGADYTSGAGTVTFTAGQTTKTVTVAVKGDTLDEFDETFTVNLANAIHATIQDGQALATITDDDAPAAVAVGDRSQAEGNAATSAATFTVSLNVASGKTVTLDWATHDVTATAGSDYSAATGSLSFAPGETTKTISVTANGDLTFEADETFTVDLSNVVNATTADAQGIGTLANDDAAPTLAISDVTVAEGDAGTSTATFTVTKTGATALPATVNWATSDTTALAVSDYAAGSGALSLAAGQTSTTVTVSVAGDRTYEPTETFHVNLSNPGGATILDAVGVGTITNDDPVPSITVSDSSVFEGDSGPKAAVFDVALSNPSYQTITVHWATNAGSAAAGIDYAGASGTVTFSPGETAKQVTANAMGDTLDENNETFTVDLSIAVAATIADAQGLATIVDDDGPVAIAVDDVAVNEGNTGTTAMTFTLSLDFPSGKPVSVDWAASGTSATAGTDFTAAGGTMIFPPDVMVETVTIDVVGDSVFEASETLAIDLSNPVNTTVNDGHGVGTITNDDKQPTKLTAGVSKTKKGLLAKGVLSGGAMKSMKVTVTIYKQKGKRYLKVTSRPAKLKKVRAGAGSYLAKLKRPKAGKYKLVVTFTGDGTHLGSSTSKRFKV